MRSFVRIGCEVFTAALELGIVIALRFFRRASPLGKVWVMRNWMAWVFLGGMCVMGTAVARAEGTAADGRFAIAIHGGTGRDPAEIPAEVREQYERSLQAALRLGRDALADGKSSLETVELVVRRLEDDPIFNAGKGAVLNSQGTHELDASIMDGRDKSCGAVAGVTTVKNPITLARLVMTRTPHVLLAGKGAEAFAADQQVELVDNKYFWTEKAAKAWEAKRRQQDQPSGSQSSTAPFKDTQFQGTVGCVALDRQGNLAAATSTGGLTNKKFGRVGDSPIIGAGTYADNATCAVSCTGIGEHFIRHSVAHTISARMALAHQPLDEAVRLVIHQTLRPGDGGIITVGHDGQIAIDFNTGGMAHGSADSTGRFQVGLGR